MKKKIISIIGTVGVPANYGGYETLVDNLIEYIDHTKYEVYIYCSSASYEKNFRKKKYKNCNLIYLPLSANGLSGFFYDNLAIFLSTLKSSTIILSLGTASAILFLFMKPLTRAKLIIHLDGQDHKREKFKTSIKAMMSLVRRLAYLISDHIIGDNEGILENLPKSTLRKTSLIEYGGDQASNVYDEKKLRSYGLHTKEYFFGVARIEPENNIHTILNAFKNSHEKLVYVGNWENSSYGKNLIEKFKKHKNILLLNPVYNLNELNNLRSNAKAYIHGHSKGGTNPSLVEAMYTGLFVIAYDVKFNRFTLKNSGFYFNDTNSLIKAINCCNSEELNSQKTKIIALAKKHYTWNTISQKYNHLFNTISS
jgi:glycosyltransferase involved in cell wall biosynthesis